MTPRQAWKKLGIEPTSDKRAIKKAYAAKLKSIDPDKDAKAFLELREALERATWESAYVESENYASEIDAMEGDEATPMVAQDLDLENGHDPAAPIRDEELATDTSPAPEFADDLQDYDDDEDADRYDGTDPDLDHDHPRNRLANILWGEGPITDAEATEAQTLFRGIIADPAMEQIDHGAQTEDWLGWIIHQTMKRSDCILPEAIEHFKWRDKLGGIHTPWYVEQIVGRARDLRRLRALQNPSHHEHAAYKRLAVPHDGPLTFVEKRFQANRNLELLRSIRAEFPTVEWDLDPETVALWEGLFQKQSASLAATGSTGLSWWQIGCFIYLFLMVIGFVFNGEPSKPGNEALPEVQMPAPSGAPATRARETTEPAAPPASLPPVAPPPAAQFPVPGNKDLSMTPEEREALMKQVEEALKAPKK